MGSEMCIRDSVRTVYSRFYQENIKEVEVQFADENPAWIPYETLLAMMDFEGEILNG